MAPLDSYGPRCGAPAAPPSLEAWAHRRGVRGPQWRSSGEGPISAMKLSC